MDKIVNYIGRGVMFLILAVSTILILICYSSEAGSDTSIAMADGSTTEFVITWTIGVFVVSILALIVSSVAAVASDKKSLIKATISFVCAVVLVLVLWALSDSTPLVMPGYEGTENCYPWLNISDVGIYLAYIALAGGIISIVVSEIINIVRK